MQSGDEVLGLARSLPVAFTQKFAAGQVTELRHAVRDWTQDNGLTGDTADDFLAAVHELVINAASHGGGSGVLVLRLGRGMVVAEVSDHGPGFAAGVPRAATLPAPATAGGRGLALARMLSDAMAIVETPEGVTAVVMLRTVPEGDDRM